MNKAGNVSSQQRVKVAQAAGIIAAGNVVSRVLGLVREIVKADLFGAGGNVSALDTAMALPKIIYALVVGGMINSALIPVLSDYAAPERRTELWRLLSLLLGVVTAAVCGLVLLGELLTPQLIRLSAGGLPLSDQQLATRLLRLMLPGVLFLSLASVLSGALYALRRFTLPAFTAAAFNLAMVVVAIALGNRWGVYSMAVGLLFGSFLQVVLQLPGLCDAHLGLVLNFRHPALRRIGRLYLPILAGLGVDKLAEVLSYRMASHTGPASPSWMTYSATIIQFPLGLVGTAISIAILPTLSRQINHGQSGRFKATLAQGLRLVLALTVPATVGLWVLSTPIVKLVFEHGDFTSADTLATVAALRFHLLGLVFAAVDQPLIFSFYARQDTWTPALVGVATVVLYVILALAPTLFVPLTLNGLILANSLKWAAHALLMLYLLRWRTGGLGGHGVWRTVFTAALLSAVMGLIVHFIKMGMSRIAPTGTMGELLLVGGAGLGGMAVYAVLALLVGMDEIRLLRRVIVG
ncbi:MAG: murein biosynthesis integral membrane protein MurJ [Anaerolineae bacterium]